MCSDPITHTDHKTGEVVTFACRTCNECIAARRNGWVDRAMAEKTCHPYALCVTLTYNTETPENRDARQVFCYADVMLFLKRLRRAAQYYAEKNSLNVVPYVRFICAGEQGERGENHCHWHIILYSNVELRHIGTFQGMVNSAKRVLTWPQDKEHMMTIRKRKRRLDWTVWGRGFVTLQEPDVGGMHYVLSYCLKDQFAAEKAEGTMRESKSEAFATGLFRMSKRPAIGEEFVVRKIEAYAAKGAVMPTLKIRIPEVEHYWYPSGRMRELILERLADANRRIRAETGRNAPQWSSLLSELCEDEKAMEILIGQEKEKDRIERERGEALVRRLENIRDAAQRFRGFKTRWLVSCQRCIRLPERFWVWKETGTLAYDKAQDRYSYRSFAGVESLDHYQTSQRGGGEVCCETCWRRDNLIAIPEEGQRSRHEARWQKKHGSSEMPPR